LTIFEQTDLLINQFNNDVEDFISKQKSKETMNVYGFQGKSGYVTVKMNGFSYDVEIEISISVPMRKITVEILIVHNSENLNDSDFDGEYPEIDMIQLADELENEMDWPEAEADYMEYMNDLNNDY